MAVDVVAVVHQDDAVVVLEFDEVGEEGADIGALFVVQRVEVAGANLDAQGGVQAVQVGR